MLLDSLSNMILLVILPALAGGMLVLQILCLYRSRRIELHQRMAEAIRLRREYEGESASVQDLLEY